MLIPLLCLLATGTRDDLTIRVEKDPRIVEVSWRIPADSAAAKTPLEFESASCHLRLAVVDKGKPGPPIFARYSRSKSHLNLKPRYPLLRGVTYLVEAMSADGTRQTKTIRVPRLPKADLPHVTKIFPSGKIIPANCLKFYIHFSQPMREGRAIFEQIQIVDAKGEPVPDPWRRTELWNEDATRLTMWIHPGRIKKGVNLREDFGPVLKPGSTYRLTVTAAVRSRGGVHLEMPFEKRFRTTDEDRTRPDPEKWKLSHPKVGTRDPLQVTFEKPLDRALLNRMLKVKTGEELVQGEIKVTAGEKSWEFTPAKNWIDRECALHIDGRLEDLAGNTPLRVFDTDLTTHSAKVPKLELPISFRELE